VPGGVSAVVATAADDVVSAAGVAVAVSAGAAACLGSKAGVAVVACAVVSASLAPSPVEGGSSDARILARIRERSAVVGAVRTTR
jgi:hypothetical protein